MGRKAKGPLRYISRDEARKLWRVTYSGSTATFSDSGYGDATGALRAAKKLRNQLEKGAGLVPAKRGPRRKTATTREHRGKGPPTLLDDRGLLGAVARLSYLRLARGIDFNRATPSFVRDCWRVVEEYLEEHSTTDVLGDYFDQVG